jgi:hypothetical protein
MPSWIGALIRFLFTWLVVVHVAYSASHDEASRKRADRAQDFFESPNLTCFEVELDQAAWQALVQRPRTYVAGKVRVGALVLDQVGVRLKGRATFEPLTKRPSLTLKFDWRLPNQRFAGLSKLLLENSQQDATLLCKLVSSGAFADAHIPTARYTQARVKLNGHELGRYGVAEAINKSFLRRSFGNANGNLYEGQGLDIGARLKQENGPQGNRSDLARLFAAATTPDLEQRTKALAKCLDVDEFLDFLAIEVMVADWDGYAYHQSNYRVYSNPDSGRMMFIPHDLDNTLFESNMPLLPPSTSLLAKAFMATSEQREGLRQRVGRLLPKVLDLERIRARVAQSVSRLQQGADPGEAERIDRRAALLLKRVEERIGHLRAELAGTRPPTLAFDANGVSQLVGWTPKPDWNQSPLEVSEEDGRPLLNIRAVDGYGFGSWRLFVWLPAGAYRLEGLARTSRVVGLPSRTGSGAGVRVVGGVRGSGLTGSLDWSPVQHSFVVQESGEAVELIAELRAFRGSASFDLRRFRLVRLSP